MQARQRLPLLTAYQVVERDVLTINGRPTQIFPQDWVVLDGDRVIDVASQETFEKLFIKLDDQPPLAVEAADFTVLAKVLNLDSGTKSQDLARAVTKLASLSIGDINIQFSPSQWEEIARRAAKRNLPVAAYMQQMLDKLLQDLWTSAI